MFDKNRKARLMEIVNDLHGMTVHELVAMHKEIERLLAEDALSCVMKRMTPEQIDALVIEGERILGK